MQNKIQNKSEASVVKIPKSPRAPTLDDVARNAGLSSMTVSRALNTPQLVRPATLEKLCKRYAQPGISPMRWREGWRHGAVNLLP